MGRFRWVAGTAVVLDGPESAPLTLALAHGAGAPMDSPFMVSMAGGIAAALRLRPIRLSVSEEIQNVTNRTGIGFIDFGVLALRACDCSKPLVLNIEELRRSSTGRSKLTSFELAISAFRAIPVIVLHVIPRLGSRHSFDSVSGYSSNR